MIQPSTIKYLNSFKKNNNKPWFEENRKQYENAKADFQTIVEKLINSISNFDVPIGNLLAKRCVFRINRDIRFSKDKTPYKTNLAAHFNKGTKKTINAGYYFHLEPGKSMLAGGIWMPDSVSLAKIRQEIDYNYNHWLKIVNNSQFKKFFPEGITSNQSLIRPPKGYIEENPAIYYLKMKSFIVSAAFTDEQVQDKSLIKEVSNTFKAMKPLLDFINKALD